VILNINGLTFKVVSVAFFFNILIKYLFIFSEAWNLGGLEGMSINFHFVIHICFFLLFGKLLMIFKCWSRLKQTVFCSTISKRNKLRFDRELPPNMFVSFSGQKTSAKVQGRHQTICKIISRILLIFFQQDDKNKKNSKNFNKQKTKKQLFNLSWNFNSKKPVCYF
jgi:hypothetical protein